MECKHKNWITAVFKKGKKPYTKPNSIYDAYCKDCKKYVSLLTGEELK